jgi:hypothetical protein
MSFPEIVSLLKDGGWGVSALAIYGMVRLYKDIQAKDALIFGLLDKQNELLKAIRGDSKPPQLGA